MSTHSISTRLAEGAHAQALATVGLWPSLLICDDAGEFIVTFPNNMPPAAAVRFANRLAAEAQRFAEKTRAEADRRTAEVKEAAA